MHASRALLAFCTTLPLLAQGNELVFVGSSVSGGADPYYLVAADTGALIETSLSPHTDNVRGAVWADGGANLFVARAPGSTPGSLPASIGRLQWNGSASTLSTFHMTPGACYGVDFDAGRQRLWALAGATPNTRELRCVDADPTSAGYGNVLAQTTVLSGAVRERFRLSASGNFAAVARTYLSVLGCLDVIDLVPTSPTYLQNIAPIVAGGGYGMDCAITPNDQYAVLLCGSPTSVVVVHIPTMTALDFNAAMPGQQHFSVPLGSAVGMSLSNSGAFAVISGIGNGGWVGRMDFDYTTPANTTFTQFLPGQVPNCRGASVSPDDTRIAVTSGDSVVGGSLILIDAATGNLLQRTALPGASSFVWTAWQRDPQFATFSSFGTGCAGSLGTPVLEGDSGSKPVLGTTFSVQVDNLPLGLGLVGFGTSTTSFGGLPLPFDLTAIGMTGCRLLAAPDVTAVLSATGTLGTVAWSIPAAATWLGFRFHAQGFVFDPIVNSAGFVTSNAASGQLGW